MNETQMFYREVAARFSQYLNTNNILSRLKVLATKPDLPAVTALRVELEEVVSDEKGVPADINAVNVVIGPLHDAEWVIQQGLLEALPECFERAIDGLAYAG